MKTQWVLYMGGKVCCIHFSNSRAKIKAGSRSKWLSLWIPILLLVYYKDSTHWRYHDVVLVFIRISCDFQDSLPLEMSCLCIHMLNTLWVSTQHIHALIWACYQSCKFGWGPQQVQFCRKIYSLTFPSDSLKTISQAILKWPWPQHIWHSSFLNSHEVNSAKVFF